MNPLDLMPLVLSYGVVGIFLVALCEKIVPLVPSYLLLMLFGTAATDDLSLGLTIAATVAGSLFATAFWYSLGRGLGEDRVRRAVARYGRYVLFREEHYDRMAGAYRRDHFRITVIGQTIPIARVYLALPAGVLRLAPLSFLAAAGIGILIYNTSFVVIGFVLRGTTTDPVSTGLWLTAGLIAMEVAAAIVVKRLRRRQYYA